MPSRTPTNGLDTANQKEIFQPESLVLGLVFTLFSQALGHRHFRQREISPRSAMARDMTISRDDE
jgi:hypothetical protein